MARMIELTINGTRTKITVAVDDISSFAAEQSMSPHRATIIKTKGGDKHYVEEDYSTVQRLVKAAETS